MRDLSWSCPYSPQTECPARSTLNPRPYKMKTASNHALRTATEAVLLPGSTPGADGTVLWEKNSKPRKGEYRKRPYLERNLSFQLLPVQVATHRGVRAPELCITQLLIAILHVSRLKLTPSHLQRRISYDVAFVK